MKWKRARSDQPQSCSVRGCPIPADTPYWIRRWRSQRGEAWVESIYCQCCGDASRGGAGIVLLGPAVLAALLVLSFVVLPIVWPGHWLAYLLIFAGSFVLLAAILSRTFFWLFRNHPQVRA